MDLIDSKYISLVSSRLQKFKRVKSDLYNFRCPICGDSQRNKNKARGYLYAVKNNTNFKCHNCGASLSFNNFLKEMDPTLHKQYWSEYNDFTNAFKIYKKASLEKCRPFVSENFNIFLELPLKIISRGFNFEIIPIKWTTRKIGQSKFKIDELSSKYLFTLLYCFLEKILIIKKN